MAGAGLNDLFLQIVTSGEPQVVGESTDSQYPGSSGYMDIDSFEFRGPDVDAKAEALADDGPDLFGDDDEDEDDDESSSERGGTQTKKKKKGKKEGKKKGKKKTTVFCFDIKKEYDNASPTLLQYYCKGLSRKPVAFTKAIVICRLIALSSDGKPKPVVVLQMTFEDVRIVKYKLNVKGEGSVPDEDITFVFKKVTMDYTPQAISGGAGAQSPMSQEHDFEADDDGSSGSS